MNRLQARSIGVVLGGRPVLNGVSLCSEAGEVHGLLGPNGAGKTSLLRVLAGLQVPVEGEALLDGQPVATLPANVRARRLVYLPQGTECHWPLRVRDVVALGRLPYRAPWRPVPPQDQVLIDEALRQTDVQHLAERAIHSLSGGERARVLLARALATGADVLLADEPVAGLDPAHQLQVMALLKERARAGCCVIVVMHDLNLAARHCDRLTLLGEGRVVAQGDVTSVLAPETLKTAYGIEAWYGEAEGAPLVVPLSRQVTGDSAP